MKKTLLLAAALFCFGVANSQVLLSEGFDDITTLEGNGWTLTNQSEPVGTTGWFQGGDTTPFTSHQGEANSYIGANFNNTTGANVISNWLITPVVTLQNDDIISFYTRVPANSNWADNLELRISTNGDATVLPSGATSVGDFSVLAITVNPDFPSPAGYPSTWTEFSYTVSGLTGEVDCKVAFRYTVPTSGGPSGDNSNFVGIDTFSIDRALSTNDFFSKNFAVYPNPANDVINLQSNSGLTIESATLTDINGRTVATVSAHGVSNTSMNIANLSAGVYILNVTSNDGVGTAKIVKK